MSGTEHEDSLHPRLRAVEERIEATIEELCEAPAAHELNTGELIRVEETLAIAAEAAKEAVSLRRRLREDGELQARRRRSSGQTPAGGEDSVAL